MQYLFLLFALMLFACTGDSPFGDRYSDYDKELSHNYKLLRAYFWQPEKIKRFSVYDGMEIDGMYADLHDTLRGGRYTFYTPPQKADDKIHDIQNTPKYYSFGFERILENDTLVVSAVYPNSPANSAGLRRHDKLLFANEESITGEIDSIYIKSDSLFSEITIFEVLREEGILTLEPMEKEEVQRPTVYLDSINGVPRIRVTEFTWHTNDPDGTYMEFKNALQQIEGTKVAIVDLRNNGGGSIYHCMAMASELSPPDRELVYDIVHYLDSKKGNAVGINREYAKDYVSGRKGYGIDVKWILLQNKYSASCSERFAASVKSGRPETVIIGETSYGKGIGQTYTKTYLGGLAYITMLQTFFPNGESFHRVGIKPDVEANPGNEDIYIAALEAAQNFDPRFLAKRLPVVLKKLPLEYPARERELGAYREIPRDELKLLHERE
jgi:C-terminal peptidase prc